METILFNVAIPTLLGIVGVAALTLFQTTRRQNDKLQHLRGDLIRVHDQMSELKTRCIRAEHDGVVAENQLLQERMQYLRDRTNRVRRLSVPTNADEELYRVTWPDGAVGFLTEEAKQVSIDRAAAIGDRYTPVS